MSGAARALRPSERRRLAALVVVLDVLVAGPPPWRGAPQLLDLSSYPVWPHPAFAPPSSYGFPPGLTNRAPLYAALYWLFHLVHAAPLELLPVLVVAPLACVGFARLLAGRAVAVGAATVLYTVNPFVYERMANGQWYVVAGYALLPVILAIAARPAASLVLTGAIGGLLVALCVATSVHYAFIVAVLLVLVAAAHAATGRRDVVASCGAVGIGAVALDLYWLVPAVRAGTGQHAGVGRLDLSVFATLVDPVVGLGVNVAGLFGFWRPGAPTIKGTLSGWPLVLAALLVLVAVGLWRLARSGAAGRALAASCAGLVVAGWLLAQGAQGPTGALYAWRFAHLAGFKVMREPQKFAALVALGYAAGFGCGVESVAGALRRHGARVACAAALGALPLLYAGTELWGFAATGAPSSYPQSWAAADAAMAPGATALSLPWSAYVALPWAAGRVTANPTQSYFARTVVSGDDLEAGPILTESANPQSGFLSYAVTQGPRLSWFGRVLAPLGIRDVVLQKVPGWRADAWLDQQRDLRRVFESPTIVVYESTEAVPGAYAPRAQATVRDWGGVLGLSERVALTDLLVHVQHARPGPLAVPARSPGVAAAAQVHAAAATPVAQPLDLTGSPRTVVLTRPAFAGWSLAGYRTTSQFGVSVAFTRVQGAHGASGAVATYTPWRLVQVSDVGGFALLAMVAASSPSRPRGGTGVAAAVRPREACRRRRDPRSCAPLTASS